VKSVVILSLAKKKKTLVGIRTTIFELNSCKSSFLDITLQWLIQHSKSNRG